MKYNLQVTEITHDELVNIFSMLFLENDFSVMYKKSLYNTIPKNKRVGDCLEDKVADCLLNGKEICVVDLQAEGQVYGNLPHKIDEEDESVSYFVTLQDFLNGFSNADALEYVKDLANENDDYWTAYNLIQFVIFGELIYG